MMTAFRLNQSMPTYPYYYNMCWYCKNNGVNTIQSTKEVNHYYQYININGDNNKKHSHLSVKNFNLTQYEIEQFRTYLSKLPGTLPDCFCNPKMSKEILKNLMRYPIECKTILINLLGTVSLTALMTNTYGNYFIQDFLLHINENQTFLILNYISINYAEIAMDYSGTHVLQALLDKSRNKINHEQIVLSAIKGKELEMAFDTNATHVIQKIITTIPEERREDLTELIVSNLTSLCVNSNGICIMKKVIKESKKIDIKNSIITKVTENCIELSQDPYGNYVIQTLFEECDKDSLSPLVNKIIKNICNLSVQKYSSNVSEKILSYSNEQQREYIINRLFEEKIFIQVLNSRYGRFVLQKAIKTMNQPKKETIKASLLQMHVPQKESNLLKLLITCF